MEPYENIVNRLSEVYIHNYEGGPSRDPEEIEEMVTCGIPFYKEGGVEVAFTKHCNFQDLYLLVHALRDFIDTIWVVKGTMKIVRIGTYFYQATNSNALDAYPLSIKWFLEIDPQLSTQFVIDNYFVKTPVNYDVNDKDFDEWEYNGWVEEDEDEPYHIKSNSYGRDTFDAMTDGQLGDYDDFKGDIDDVRIWSGRN